MLDIPSVVKALGGHGTAAAVPLLAMYSLFTPAQEFHEFVAQSRTGSILELVEKAKAQTEGPFKQTLCAALQSEIGLLCMEAQTHSFCVDRNLILQDAGCRG